MADAIAAIKLDEKNGFIYVIYTNHEGQTSQGWLSKGELLQVK